MFPEVSLSIDLGSLSNESPTSKSKPAEQDGEDILKDQQ